MPYHNNAVIAPDGTKFYMWADNPWDVVNVNERVIVSADDIAKYGSGTWEVRVRSRYLHTDTQRYSLVVTGPISPPVSGAVVAAIDDDGIVEDSAAPPSIVTGGTPFLLAALSALAALVMSA